MTKGAVAIILLAFLSSNVFGQINADSLFNAAVQHSREKEYHKAIEDASIVLTHYPNRADIILFLANVNAWSGDYSASKPLIERAFKINPKDPHLYDIWLNLLLWNNEFNELLKVINLAQENGYTNSYNILLKEVLALKGLKEPQRAIQLIHQNENYLDSSAINYLYYELQNQTRQNVVSAFYSIDFFEKNNPKPQHLAFVDYGVKIRENTLLFRGSYANRFEKNDFQAEVDYYHTLPMGRYIYSNYGVGVMQSLFPSHRAGLEYYTPIAKALEVSLGARFLNFNNSSVFIVTGHIGNYIGKWWLAARPFYAFKGSGNSLSALGNLRLFGDNGVNYWGVELGYGNSPDDKYIASQLSEKLLLDSYRIKIEKNLRISKANEVRLATIWAQEEQSLSGYKSRISFELIVNHKF